MELLSKMAHTEGCDMVSQALNLIWKLNFVAHCIINIDIYLDHLGRFFVEHLHTSTQREYSKNTYT